VNLSGETTLQFMPQSHLYVNVRVSKNRSRVDLSGEANTVHASTQPLHKRSRTESKSIEQQMSQRWTSAHASTTVADPSDLPGSHLTLHRNRVAMKTLLLGTLYLLHKNFIWLKRGSFRKQMHIVYIHPDTFLDKKLHRNCESHFKSVCEKAKVGK